VIGAEARGERKGALPGWAGNLKDRMRFRGLNGRVGKSEPSRSKDTFPGETTMEHHRLKRLGVQDEKRYNRENAGGGSKKIASVLSNGISRRLRRKGGKGDL